ncbi:MAG TPA: hypothetical protein VFV14_10550, partial [Myxococcaceae bacterium]|nr:hypothetical protein [Myxococcaceae bacterium]
MSPSTAVESVPPRHTVVTENLVASGIVLMLAMFWIAFYQRIPEIGADSSCYIGLAQSLSTIGAYEFNYQNHTIYPPGFPLLLALLSALARREPAASYAIFMSSIAVGAGLTLLVSYWLIRSLVNARWALVYVALAGASP